MKRGDRWANERWNLSLLPIAPANEGKLCVRKLENIDELRSPVSFIAALRAKSRASSGTLV